MEKKIIIIEDNETAFERLKKSVCQIGQVVVDYQELNDALTTHKDYCNIRQLLEAKFREYGKAISLFIIDLKLSDYSKYDGINAIKDIRQASINEYWRTIVPIIVYTNFPDQEAQAKESGANEVIKKSSNLEQSEENLKKKTTWYQELDNHLSTVLLPKVREYSDWYSTSIERIEHTPLDLQPSAITFFKKNNNPYMKHVFVMTSFESGYMPAIKSALKNVEDKFFVTAHIADKKTGETTNQLFNNVKTLMHCCDFGIGVFFDDKKKKNTINPNLSLEVGYMLGIGNKERICYLKDASLEVLQTDLASELYVDYSNSRGKGTKEPTMKAALEKWIIEKKSELGIVEKPK